MSLPGGATVSREHRYRPMRTRQRNHVSELLIPMLKGNDIYHLQNVFARIHLPPVSLSGINANRLKGAFRLNASATPLFSPLPLEMWLGSPYIGKGNTSGSDQSEEGSLAVTHSEEELFQA